MRFETPEEALEYDRKKANREKKGIPARIYDYKGRMKVSRTRQIKKRICEEYGISGKRFRKVSNIAEKIRKEIGANVLTVSIWNQALVETNNR